MKRAFAYICVSEECSTARLGSYCRQVYELGYIPVCPRLEQRYYLYDTAEDKRQAASMAQEMLFRCRMAVVCGPVIGTMLSEIRQAEKWHIICTTLEGLAKIKDVQTKGGE